MNVADLVTDITGVSAKNQFYVYGIVLLAAILIACMNLEGADPFNNVKFVAWRAYQMTGV